MCYFFPKLIKYNQNSAKYGGTKKFCFKIRIFKPVYTPE